MRDMPRDDGRLGGRNILLAVLAGVLCAGAIYFFGVSGLDPSLWDEVAVASLLRPPHSIFPGYWRFVAAWLFPVFGFENALFVLRLAGAVLGGCCTYIFFMVVRQILALVIHTSRTYAVWHRIIAPTFAFFAAVLFGMSDPLWRICHVMSPDILRLTLMLATVHLSVRWFTAGGRWRLFPAFAVMGLMSAETPIGFLLPAMFVLAYVAVWHCILDSLFKRPDNLPSPEEMPKWRMFFLFLGFLAFGVWLNGAVFVFLDGLSANGWSATDIYFRYAAGYWHVLADAASLVGWTLGVGICVIPLVLAIRIFPIAARDDRPMPFNLGVMMFLCGALGVMQSGAFPAARFWTYAKEIVMVESGFLLTFFVACSMTTFALAGAAFAFECQRKYLTVEDGIRPGRLLRGVVPALGIFVVVLALLHLGKPAEKEVQKIVDDALAEIVEECGDAKWLFTDGRLDAGVEIAAAAAGKSITTLNMMSGATEWERTIRLRGFEEGTGDWETASTGIPALLRVWAGEKTNGMDRAAIQLGFEFWKRERKPLPATSGMVARPKGMTEEAKKAGIERSIAISKRILEVSGKMDAADPSPALAGAFSAVSWRLSRFARLREDAQLADSLDISNSALRRMLSLIEYERMRTFMQLTPREGLRIALQRADFKEARRYSLPVLANDEDDPEANFAMGMDALSTRGYSDAERYLRRCLKRRPNEPAVLNNLSIICRKMRRWQEAEDLARKALELLPSSPEVRQTLADALNERKKAGK